MSAKRVVLGAVMAALLATSQASYGWGGRGHAVIDRTAIDALPGDGPVFLKKYVDDIARSGSMPDWWRDSAFPDDYAAKEEGAKHGWPTEKLHFLKDIPRSRAELALAFAAHYPGQPPVADGSIYAAAEAYGHLLAGFRVLRQARAAGLPTNFLEMSSALYVAWLGHYIGDASEPLHDTMHGDGWVGPNPNGYDQAHGIHIRFEVDYVEKIGLTEHDVLGRVGPPTHQTGDVFPMLVDYVNERNSKVEPLYQLDKRMHFADPGDKEARELVYSSITAGAAMLRDLVNRAWTESALPCECRTGKKSDSLTEKFLHH